MARVAGLTACGVGGNDDIAQVHGVRGVLWERGARGGWKAEDVRGTVLMTIVAIERADRAVADQRDRDLAARRRGRDAREPRGQAWRPHVPSAAVGNRDAEPHLGHDSTPRTSRRSTVWVHCRTLRTP